jgi:acyl-CoA reductase-like NAD-dependent aldehyde dehydrogenase
MTATWAALPVRARLAVLRRLRHAIAEQAPALAQSAARPGASEADILVSEVMPLLAAIRFLEQRAERLLAPRRERRGRPIWLFGTRLTIRRLPLGQVLVIAPGNYPLMLPAIQAVQALAAGNTVLVKPAPGFSAPLALLGRMLAQAGLPGEVFTLLDDTAEAARRAIAAGVDMIVLTGSSATGRAVLADAAAHLTPCIMELSGDDAFVVLPGADMAYAARALAFGRTFNAGNTCIAPRRVIVVRAAEAAFRAAASDQTLQVAADEDAAVELANASPYALGAAVFGTRAETVAARLRAGCVVVGDAIAPTADPRLPFGGAGESGFGATRGAEGLLALTRPQAVVTRARPEWRHLTPLSDRAAQVVARLLRLLYGRWWSRT